MLSDRDDLTGAEEMYKQALEEDPHDIGTLFSYGRFLCEDKDDCDEGIKMYDRVLVEVFDGYNPSHVLADTAVNIFQDQNDFDTLSNYGQILYSVKMDYDKAVEMFQQALAQQPDHIDTLFSYGMLMKDVKKDYDKAEGIFQAILKIDPNDAQTLLSYAGMLTDIRHNHTIAAEMKKRGEEIISMNKNLKTKIDCSDASSSSESPSKKGRT